MFCWVRDLVLHFPKCIMNWVKSDSNIKQVLGYNTRSRTKQNTVSFIQYILKAQSKYGSIETGRNM